ncbi:ParA family protein [Clavibacter michiganensis]|uniref:ParA family protein n=1 Tax=Clavibacter michiganensis TaxID=28447 RepID=UPI003DA1AF81
MRIVAVVQQKGGVGKTTIAVNLAAVTAEHSRVLVVDADHVQHSATDWAEASEAEGATAWPFDFTDDARPEVLSQLRARSCPSSARHRTTTRSSSTPPAASRQAKSSAPASCWTPRTS